MFDFNDENQKMRDLINQVANTNMVQALADSLTKVEVEFYMQDGSNDIPINIAEHITFVAIRNKVSLEEAFVFVAKRITEVAQKRKMWMQELENESKDYDDDRESFDNVDGVSNLIRALCNLADSEYDSDCDSDEFADSDDECQVGGECGRILH